MPAKCSKCGESFDGTVVEHRKRCFGDLVYALRNANGVEQLVTVPLAFVREGEEMKSVFVCLCSHCHSHSPDGWSPRPSLSALKQHMCRLNSHWMGSDPAIVLGDRVPTLYWSGQAAAAAACTVRAQACAELEIDAGYLGGLSEAEEGGRPLSTSAGSEASSKRWDDRSDTVSSEGSAEPDALVTAMSLLGCDGGGTVAAVGKPSLRITIAGRSKRIREELETGDRLEATRPKRTEDLRFDPEFYLESIGMAVNISLGYIVCLECGVCVLPADVRAHVRTSHPATLPLVNARSMVRALDSFDIEIREVWIDPGEQIRPAYDGILIRYGNLCEYCSHYALPSLGSLRKHYGHAHRDARFDAHRAFEKVPIQSLTTAVGPARKYFRVSLREEDAMDVDSLAVVRTLRDELEHVLALPGPQDTDCRRFEVWVGRFGFAAHVAGRVDFESLCKLVELPGAGDRLHRVLVAICDLDSQACGLIESTSVLIRRRLATGDPEKGLNRRPVLPFQSAERRLASGDTYTHTFYRFLLLVLRTHPSESHDYDLPLPQEVSAAVDALYRAVHVSGRQYDPAGVRARVDGVLRAVLMREWEPVHDNLLPDPVVRSVLLSMLTTDGRWRSVRLITPILAKLKRMVRMFMLVEIHRLRSLRQASNGGEDVSLDAVSKELQEFYTEGRPTTFNSLSEMQAFASAVALQQFGVPRLYWLDTKRYEEFQFDGDRMSRSMWVAMLHAMQDAIQASLRDLVFGRADLFVDLSSQGDDGHILTDDPSNERFGYSLFTDVRNERFFPADRRDRLLAAVASDGDLSRQYLRVNGAGAPAFVVTACREWLSAYARFSKLCLAFAVLSGGGPARGTELTAMNFANGRDGSMRNLILFGTTLSWVLTYSKMSSIKVTSRRPQAMDAFMACVAVQDYGVLRPFAMQLANAVYPGDLSVRDLYLTKAFVCRDRLFTTQDLSDVITEWSTEHLGARLTISGVRHILIGIKHKRLDIQEIEDEDEEDDIDAMMAGHSKMVDRTTYARTTNVDGQTADEKLFWKQLNSCRGVHILFELVPAGVLSSLEETHYSRFDEDWKRHIPLDAALSRYRKETLSAVEPLFREQSAAFDAALGAARLELMDALASALTPLQEGQARLLEQLSTVRSGACSEPACAPSHGGSSFPAGELCVPSVGVGTLATVVARGPDGGGQVAAATWDSEDPSETEVRLVQSTQVGATGSRTDLAAELEALSDSEQDGGATSASGPGVQRPTPRSYVGARRAGRLGSPSDSDSVVVRVTDEGYSLSSDTDGPPSPYRSQPGTWASVSRRDTNDLSRRAPVTPSSFTGLAGQPSTASHSSAASSASMEALEALAAATLSALVNKDSGQEAGSSRPEGARTPWSCGGQRLAVLATLAYRQDVVVVLPTGYGKSMVAFVAARMEKRSLTVFVAPLRAVRANAKRTLQGLDIPFQEYVPGRHIGDEVRVLLVSGDMTSWGAFFSDLNAAVRRSGYETCRIVVDEAHVPPLSEGYRRALSHMNEVRTVKAQMVLLTATLPPAMETTIRAAYALQPGAGTAFVRCSTNRPEITYSIVDGAQTVSQAAKSAATHFSRSFEAAEDRAILFVTTAADGAQAVDALESKLGSRPPFYCGKSANGSLDEAARVSDEDRQSLLQAWSSGLSGRLIVATQALEAGHHDSRTRAAYFLRSPWSMIGFQQASGRVARDGRSGVSVVYPIADGKALPPVPGRDLAGVADLRALVKNKTACIRQALTVFADGAANGVRCSAREHAQFNRLCSRCARREGLASDLDPPNPSPSPKLLSAAGDVVLARPSAADGAPFAEASQAAVARRADRIRRETGASAPLIEALDILDERCPVCLMADQNSPSHDLFRCPSLRALPGSRMYTQLNRGIYYRSPPTFAVCFTCHFPLNVHGLPHPNIAGVAGRPDNCPHPDVLKPISFVIRQQADWRNDAADRFGQDWASSAGDTNLVKWLGQESDVGQGGRGLTNMQELFLWVMSVLRERERAVERGF